MTWNSGLPSMFAAPSSWRMYHAPLRLVGDLLLAEGVGLVGEVAAEDDRVGPHVADDVGGEVRLLRGAERAEATLERGGERPP